ncbi:MAG: hypothetical protein ACR2JH_08385 [Solirubrobacteraceae bacterium]
MRVTQLIIPTLAVAALAGAPGALASGSGSGSTPTATGASGGAGVGAPPPGVSTAARPLVTGSVARIRHGVAYAPSYAPIQVQRAIWAGNLIRKKPYIYGGGHGSFTDSGYDCSGSVSFVLHAAGLVGSTPMDSSEFMSWGQEGLGHWITVYTNPGHAFVEIAGIRFDTSAEADPHPARGSGPRWRPLFRHPSGFSARHPLGL